MQRDGIAIIGIGCRFPGGINDTESFWRVLAEGRDVVSDVPADRWNVERFYDAEPGIAGKSIARRGGFISGIDEFDPQFFGISPREAPFVDPQQRLLLETAWEAIEDAGVVLDIEGGTDIGVFAGLSHTDYQNIQGGDADRARISAHSPRGNAHSIAANRISYCFNLKGPSLAVDTACSSALTAVHLACEQIRAGRCTMALAGGVTVMILPDGFIGFSQAGMLSPDGKCQAFSAGANGFVRGEGAGMVLLKPLSQALADGNPIYGVILGSSLNQDGHTNGIAVPSPEAQARLVSYTCIDAGVAPSHVGFVEAHGTGTAVGDPIEATALSNALCVDRPADAPLPIGSVKTNLGHLETAAGVAGLIKAVLMLQRAQIPPSLHFNAPNPHIDFAALKLRVPTATEEFPKIGGRRIAGVNSFGFGGANAHVILEEAPARESAENSEMPVDRGWPMVFSARSENALKAAAARMALWVGRQTSVDRNVALLPALTYTLGARRNHHPHRFTMVAHSAHDLAAALHEFSTEGSQSAVRASFTPRPGHPLRIAFVMSGQGPQWWGMGRELLRTEPVFRETIEACAEAMRPHARFSLLEELNRDEAASRLEETEIAQPAIFAMQVALAELWKSIGVAPTALVGHSVGEIAAACVAGVLSVAEASRVIVLRGRLMQDCARGEGAMLAVGLSEEEALAMIARHDPTVSIAAFNGPRSLTLAGTRTTLEAMQSELEAGNAFARFVRVNYPFHHAMMQPAAEALAVELAALAPRDESVPLFSTLTGQRCAGRDCTADHWARGIRQSVQFVSAADAVADFGVDVWLEIGCHPALAVSIQECLAVNRRKAVVLASTRREREHDNFLEAALELHRAGVSVDFAAMTPSRTLLSLPAYPWDKSRWWYESRDVRESRLAAGGKGLLEMRLSRAAPTWITRLDSRHMAFLKDHKVDDHIIFPAAAFVEMALEAGVQLFDGRAFVIEDLEIRKPLILPDPITGLLLEMTCDPGDGTFTIRSRFEQASSWSEHVVGSIRGERAESSFAATAWQAPDRELEPQSVSRFYDHMSDRGIRYGEAFRPVCELVARDGRSAGKVLLSDGIAPRAREYAIHPVLLDGAMQVFAAAARSMESRRGLKLPVRFARILFLRSPGAGSLVRARVLHFNDDSTEGRVALYDEEGRPCVRIDGFRVISMTAARSPGASGSGRDLLYHVGWERLTSTRPSSNQPPVPLAQLCAAAGNALEEINTLRGPARLQEAMIAAEQVAAAHLAQGLCAMSGDVAAGKRLSAESLGVVASMRPVFERLMSQLSKRGLLTAKGGSYKPNAKFAKAAASATEVLRRFVADHPGHLTDGLLSAITAADLGEILRGQKDAVEVLFGSAGIDLLEHFYGDGLLASPWMACVGGALQEAARHLPEGRGLRILEVGAGTGGLAAQLLPLLERGVHSYTFTDVSAGFFPQANQKLDAFPEVEYRVLDLDRPVGEQGFEPCAYDFIVGSNVLHAVADVRFSLRSLRDLLVPGGTLMFIDVATPRLWTESIFGLTSGWWHLTDRDLRPNQPLLQRAQWEAALHEGGFAETASLPGLTGPDGGEVQVAVIARKGDAENSTREETSSERHLEKSWLIFADASGLGSEIAAQVRAAGARCRIISKDAPELFDWTRLFTVDDEAPERVVYMWSMDSPCDRLMGTDDLLHLVHALEESMPGAHLRLDLVTRGVQQAGRDRTVTAVAQAASIGMFRVIRNEYPHYTCRSIDLPPLATASDNALLWSELLQTDNEREIVFRGEARYGQRLTRGMPRREEKLDASVPLRLEFRDRGLPDRLHFAPFVSRNPGPGEVLIKVAAAGLNFRDVLKALEIYPAETADARIFGDEVAGEVLATGEGVRHLKPGDRAFGLAEFGLATHTLARAAHVQRIPAGLSFEEAATIPVVFVTAWHSLKIVARLKAGETILVHSGAGGVGMAAIQIAHHLGARVIASAGNPVKRRLLKTMGVSEVIDSRHEDFAESVMELTNGRGVDVVLNALASEAIPMGMSCLAESGRFVEIGKRDVYQNSRIPLRPLRRNCSFHVVAMDALAGDEKQKPAVLAEITRLVEKKRLRPLPFRSIPASRIHSAFRLMASGKHIGKVVIAFADAFLVRQGEPLLPGFAVRPDAAYLLTGGMGGFGRVLSEWLVKRGARHLVLANRSGASTAEAVAFVEELRNKGAEIRVVPADIGSPEAVQRLVRDVSSGPIPLKGVFHLAMVLDDAPLSELTTERLRAVMAPKAHGAWLLHESTKGMDLDCFVLFSSVSGIFGHQGQGNYAAANVFLDSLAHHRRALGLPGLSINWGVLGGEGYVARNPRIGEFLARQGTAALAPGEVTTLLESFLQSNATQVAAIRLDWSKWRQFFRNMQENPFVERIFSAGVDMLENTGGLHDWKARIAAAAPDERDNLIRQAMREIVGSVLRVKPDSLRDDQALTDLGLDSLMGVEIETMIEAAIGVTLPSRSLLRARTIGQIAALVAGHLAGPGDSLPAQKIEIISAAASPSSVDEVDLDSLSDEDIDRLLEGEATVRASLQDATR